MRVFLILFIFLWNTAWAQDFNSAIEYFRSKDYKKADIELTKILVKNKKDAVAWFNLAQSKYQQKDFKKALSYFEYVVRLKSDYSPAAQYYMSFCYLNLNQPEKAVAAAQKVAKGTVFYEKSQILIKQILSGTDEYLLNAQKFYEEKQYEDCIDEINESVFRDAPKGEKIYAECLLPLNNAGANDVGLDGAALDSEQTAVPEIVFPKKNLAAYADLSAGHSSNIYLESSNPTTAFSHALNLGGEYLFYQDISYGLGLNYNYSNSMNVSNLRQDDLNFYVPVELNRANYDLRLETGYSIAKSNSANSYSTLDFNFLYSYYFADYSMELSGDINKKNSSIASYDYIAGDYNSLKLLANYYNSSFKIGGFVKVSKSASGDLPVTGGTLPYANISRSYGVDLSYKFSNQYKFILKYAISNKDYTNIYSSLGTKRLDINSSLNFKLNYKMSDNIGFYIQDIFTINKSNYNSLEIQNKNYSENSLYLGLSWNL